MKHKSTNKLGHKQKTATPSKRPRRFWTIFLVIILASVGVIIYQNSKTGNETNYTTTSDKPNLVPDKTDQKHLVGRWARTDSEGAYVIEIGSVASDGNLVASYFNPHPIKIGYARWHQTNGKLVVVVELRDVNYPGSTYTLNYISTEDKMTGNYFQAVEGANYDVEFVRIQ